VIKIINSPMENPYHILNVNQNATKKDILKAQIEAMRIKKYSLQEIGLATRQLLDPAKRLAADFMLPARMKAKRPQKIMVEIQQPAFDIKDINENAFNSI